MNEKIETWRGKPIEQMTREELIEALKDKLWAERELEKRWVQRNRMRREFDAS